MADKPEDDRSMSEILASIRKIVTEEEESRKAAEPVQEPKAVAAPVEGGDGVLVLSGNLRTDDEAPLDLGAASRAGGDEPMPLRLRSDDAKPRSAVDFAPAEGLGEGDIEDIVRRIVREELKGPIGQDINRKLKAMIREEIARELANGEEDGLI